MRPLRPALGGVEVTVVPCSREGVLDPNRLEFAISPGRG